MLDFDSFRRAGVIEDFLESHIEVVGFLSAENLLLEPNDCFLFWLEVRKGVSFCFGSCYPSLRQFKGRNVDF